MDMENTWTENKTILPKMLFTLNEDYRPPCGLPSAVFCVLYPIALRLVVLLSNYRSIVNGIVPTFEVRSKSLLYPNL